MPAGTSCWPECQLRQSRVEKTSKDHCGSLYGTGEPAGTNCPTGSSVRSFQEIGNMILHGMITVRMRYSKMK